MNRMTGFLLILGFLCMTSAETWAQSIYRSRSSKGKIDYRTSIKKPSNVYSSKKRSPIRTIEDNQAIEAMIREQRALEKQLKELEEGGG